MSRQKIIVQSKLVYTYNSNNLIGKTNLSMKNKQIFTKFYEK